MHAGHHWSASQWDDKPHHGYHLRNSNNTDKRASYDNADYRASDDDAHHDTPEGSARHRIAADLATTAWDNLAVADHRSRQSQCDASGHVRY